MNAFVDAMDRGIITATRTANGAQTLSSTGDKALDLFSVIGSIKSQTDFTRLFETAYLQNPRLAIAVLLWGRDVRGGSGRRQVFRTALQWLEQYDFENFVRVIAHAPTVGRWDDVLVAKTEQGRTIAYGMVARALSEKDALCAKWMPRKATPKDDTAARLREFMALTPRQYRKLLVNLTDVVETKMCAREWSEIEYSKLPSVAGARYAKAFGRHDAARYQQYINDVAAGKAKVNTGALYPYDLVRTARSQDSFATQAWKNLPNYMEESDKRILPLVDTSGSMGCAASGSVTCMEAAISLGLYIAERNVGPFQHRMINFNDRAEWIQYSPNASLMQRYNQIQRAPWGGSTNLQSAFDLILSQARANRVPASDMPTHLLILSDMEFNIATGNYHYRYSMARSSENYAEIDRKYREAGYERPNIIFWNLNGRSGNNPVTAGEAGTALISGFSPAIMKTALGGKNVTPLDIMLETVLKPRYDILSDA